MVNKICINKTNESLIEYHESMKNRIKLQTKQITQKK